MNFLLIGINSKYIHSNPAIRSLKSSLKEEDRRSVQLTEYTVNQELAAVRRDICRKKPDAIGFSCYIWNIRYVMDLSQDLSVLMPEVPIWLGGPEVSYRAADILEQSPWIAGVIAGEGEDSFRELIGRLRSGEKNMEGMKGLVWRDENGRVRDSGFGSCADFSRLPFLYGDEDLPADRIIYYETSRGCPFRCSYCLSSIDKRIRLRDMDLVFRELQFFLEKKVSQVKLVDRTFNCVRSRAREIWRFLMEHDNGVTNFHFEIGADLLEEEDFDILSRMRKGLVQLEIGVQTTNKQTLQAIRREASEKEIFAAVRRISSFGNIHQHLDLIAGLPYEDYESFARSFNAVYSLHPSQLQLGFLKVLSGTDMEKEADQYGILYENRPPYEVLSTKWLSYQELCRLKETEEAVETFYNSRQFEAVLVYLEERIPDAFSLYGILADWLSAACRDGGRPGRRRLYEYLAGCLSEKWPSEEKLQRQLLTYDYYARENAGARPSFAQPQSVWKEEEKQFYIKEARERKYLKGYEMYDSRQLQHITHAEVFDWDLEVYRRGGGLIPSKVMVIFDYKNRNFATSNANAVTIPFS